MNERCSICLEDRDVDQMFVVTGCEHRYCFSCMSRHVQFKLFQGFLPKCPYEDCNSGLELDRCQPLLSPELFEIMRIRVREASIPAADKVYCPYPGCSTLWSINELQGLIMGSSSRCPRCNGMFCISCKVPWHTDMSCDDYKRLNPDPWNEEERLMSLATRKQWIQCPNCNFMVSLAKGCNRMTCRCECEFCYTCGGKWEDDDDHLNCEIWGDHEEMSTDSDDEENDEDDDEENGG